MVRSLDSLDPGTRGHVVRLEGERRLRRRLMELGCLPGTPIRLIRRANVGGVLELEVRRSRLTLRVRDARHLLIAPMGPSAGLPAEAEDGTGANGRD